jgi:peptidoglycan/LPS O-acetylase OafA/YrhL
MPRADDPALTAARGLAAFWVFVYHAWLSIEPQRLAMRLGEASFDLTPLASAGWAGVDLFFVLSGFLLWGLFDDCAACRANLPSLTRYARRRALRILPPYYAQVALLALLGLATAWVERPSATTLALHLTLTHGLSYAHFQAVNNVWWTLSIEAQFYVLLPLLALAVRRFGWVAVLIGGVAVMLAWRVYAFDATRDGPVIERVWLIEQLPGRIDQFLLGMLAAHLARAPEDGPARLRAALGARKGLRISLALAGPVTMLALAYLLHVDDFYLRYWQGHPWLYAWHFVAGAAIALSLYAVAIRPNASAAVGAVWRPWVALGVVSYSFYLWHELVLRWFSVWVKSALGAATPAAFAVNFSAGLALSLAVAIAWYAAFERPFLRPRATLRDR